MVIHKKFVIPTSRVITWGMVKGIICEKLENAKMKQAFYVEWPTYKNFEDENQRVLIASCKKMLQKTL